MCLSYLRLPNPLICGAILLEIDLPKFSRVLGLSKTGISQRVYHCRVWEIVKKFSDCLMNYPANL